MLNYARYRLGCYLVIFRTWPIPDRISILIIEQVYFSTRYMHFVYIYRFDLILGHNRLFTADSGDHLMSRLRLGLMFTRVCACRKLTETTSTPSWSGIGQVARLANPNARSCAGSWVVDRGNGPTSSPGSLLTPRVACHYSPVGFDRQQKATSPMSARTKRKGKKTRRKSIPTPCLTWRLTRRRAHPTSSRRKITRWWLT
jgi:hypothetical protein